MTPRLAVRAGSRTWVISTAAATLTWYWARNSAGDAGLFKSFYASLEDVIYQKDVSLADALKNVRLSKQLIDQEQRRENGFNVKLGTGGIREIEFIAQAPQLALGSADPWLRAPHTLISLGRLVDRSLLNDRELTQLSEAYAFLRTLEHRLHLRRLRPRRASGPVRRQLR